jgi:hypothetical protein
MLIRCSRPSNCANRRCVAISQHGYQLDIHGYRPSDCGEKADFWVLIVQPIHSIKIKKGGGWDSVGGVKLEMGVQFLFY